MSRGYMHISSFAFTSVEEGRKWGEIEGKKDWEKKIKEDAYKDRKKERLEEVEIKETEEAK